MIGVFEMQTVNGDHFKVEIPDIDLIADDISPKDNSITYN